MRALIKAKHEEQAEVQRGILADMDHITEAELDKRHDISNTLDDEIDSLLAQYKRLSAALGVEATPRGACSAILAPQEPKTSKPRRVITRPPGAVKGGGVKNSSLCLSRPPLPPPKLPVDVKHAAVHINPLASATLTSVQAMSECVVNV